MSVPSWHRHPSKLQVLWDAHKLRNTVENFVYSDFGFHVDTVMRTYLHSRKVRTYEQLDDECKKKYDLYKGYCEELSAHFVPAEKEIIMKYMRKVEMDLTYVDTIYPTTIEECNTRRQYCDFALADLNCLETEIQHTLMRLPTKKHAWKHFELMLGDLQNRVYNLRTSNNKIRNSILRELAKQILEAVMRTLCSTASQNKGKTANKKDDVKVENESVQTTVNNNQKEVKKTNKKAESVKPVVFNIKQFGLILHYGSSNADDNTVKVTITPDEQ